MADSSSEAVEVATVDEGNVLIWKIKQLNGM